MLSYKLVLDIYLLILLAIILLLNNFKINSTLIFLINKESLIFIF